MITKSLQGNISKYPWYLFFRDCYFWGPAFFLFFSSILSLPQVLWLEAIYYVSVALLEVPSGYLSDRFGRRITLFTSSLSLAAAYLLFLLGSSFAVFVVAQVLLAVGFAAASGTDTALHFESLKQTGREDEYAEREARAMKRIFYSGAVAALLGGLLAMGHLRLIYAGSLITSLISALIVLTMIEPQSDSSKVLPLQRQVSGLVKKSWSRRFRFFTFYSLSMTILVHLPYEFYQPYLETINTAAWSGDSTPLIAGAHLALTMLVGAWFTRFGGRIDHRCLVWKILVLCAFGQAMLISSMALFTSPLVALLLIGRTAAKGIATPLINAEISPLLEQNERSTYLSLQSLTGRLGYGLILLVLPLAAALFKTPLQGSLAGALGVAIILFSGILLFRFPRDNHHDCCSSGKLTLNSLFHFKKH